MSTDVSKAEPLYDDETLGSIQSFEDAIAVLRDSGIEVHSTREYGDGFDVIDDKSKLVDVPFIIMGMQFPTKAKFGDGFVVLRIVTKDGGKYFLTDGSTGVYKQALLYASKGITTGLFCEKGLIRSDYEVDLPDPKTGELKATAATTFYLS